MNRLKELLEIENVAKKVVDLATEDDDIISQDNLFRLQVEANDLYHKIKDLRKDIEFFSNIGEKVNKTKAGE